ncbi:archease [Halorussus litoreus]|uniref:archease n=1 Tax=Halorussus litoreus TaxID=1710536 RepID=UPI000E25800B|nr:archease [Halorussus litoreus]
MGYELRDHTADVAVEATGPTLGATFAAAADGMAAAMCDVIPESGGERFPVEVRAESREALLFDYLDELIYQRDVRGVLPVDNEAAVRESDVREPAGDDGEWTLTGAARGVPLAGLGARDLKAVTYSEMDLRETDDGWRAYVVFDV